MEYAFLEHCLREDLNETAQRVMAVLRPVKLTIANYPEGQSETFEVENNPNRPEDGTRAVTFSRHLYVEAEDFLPEPGAQVQAALSRRPGVPAEGGLSDQVRRLRHGRGRATSPRSWPSTTPTAGAATPPTAAR